MTTEKDRAPASKEATRPQSDIGSSARPQLLHFPLFEQLKRRNVFRVAALYLVVCWLILEPVHVVFHMLDVPIWANRLVVMIMALGFPAAVIFAWVYEITPEGLKPTIEVPHGQSIRKATGRRLDVAIIAVLAVALTYFVVDKFWFSKRTATAAARTVAASPTMSEKSVAVLPFVDMSEKHDQAYFADGMAEEVIDLLAKLPGLRVIGRTSSFQFRGKSVDVRTIGSQLQAAYVLEGSVRRSNDQVRVTAQLVGTQDGIHRWSGTYDAKLDNVFRVQEAIAAAISRSLELAISDVPTQDRSATSAEAYDLYMRGLHALDSSSREGCEQAIGLFSQILREEPNSERALISLARAHECIAWGAWNIPDAGLPQARDFATRTLNANPKSAAAHLVLATADIEHEFDWAAAQREIDAAFNLAPPTAQALTVAARLQQALGQFDRAIDLLNQALEREPLDPLIYDTLGDTYMRAGIYERAEAMYRRCLQIAPNFIVEHFYVSNALLMRGRLEEALAEVNLETDNEAADFGRALIFHAMGKSADSDMALTRALAANNIHWSAEVARVYAFRGELDQAFEWLDRAYQQRDVDLYYVKGDPLLKNLEPDPRYKTFLRRMNLPD
jgi:TolB-like protein/Flp pilus assembly protein TadD